MKIAVTGAAGHVGGNLLRELLKLEHEVSVLYFKDDRPFRDLPVRQVRGNLHDEQALRELINGQEVVIHLAAEISIDGSHGGSVRNTNVEGVRNICRICLEEKIRRLVHFSSIHAFNAFPREGILDENRPRVTSSAVTYDLSKANGEDIVREYVTKGLNAVILNPTSVIGPLDYKPSLMGQVFIQLYNRSLPALVGGGYDFVDVRDVAHAAVLAIDKGRCGENYLISGEWRTIKELAAVVEEVTGKRAPAFTSPFWLAHTGVPFMMLWSKITHKHPLYTRESLHVLKNSHFNITSKKAKEELGFSCRPLKETVTDLYAWFKENNMLEN